MKLTFLSALVLSSMVFFSCSKSGEDILTPPSTDPAVAATTLNVAYGADAKQKMDVYLPAGRSSSTTKVLVMIHGGGWTEGDKTDFTEFVDTLKKRLPTYAIININYRLVAGTANLFPTQENDVKSAIEFINGKRSDYAISDKFVLLGASAGGHLALLQGYKYTSPIKVKAVVNFFGPSDMADMYNNPASIFAPPSAIQGVVGGTPTTNSTMYFQSSPINFVAAQSPATITLQGGLDPLVRPAQQTALQAKLNAAGVTNEYVFYPNEYHGWTGANLINSFDRVTAFINANVQ